jgi:hypothetical protein
MTGRVIRAEITWYRVDYTSPPENTILMVTGDSGYITHSRFLCLAYFDETFRPRLRPDEIRWLDVQNNALTDCGWVPEFWAFPVELP